MRLDLVAVRILAVILIGAAAALGAWAINTSNSTLFGRLTGLAGVFSLVLATAVAAVGMIKWSARHRQPGQTAAAQDGQMSRQDGGRPGATAGDTHIKITGGPTTINFGSAADPEPGQQAEDVSDADVIGKSAVAVPAPGLLPRDIPDFTARVAELARLTELARGEASAVVVICGTAGVGKTALAVHGAYELLAGSAFPGGHLYADFRGYTEGRKPAEPGEVLENFLRRLGVAPADMPAELDERSGLLRQLLESRRTLLVLDNVRTEQQVRPLLPGRGRSVALITSRSTLLGLSVDERMRLDVLAEHEATDLLSKAIGTVRVQAEPTQVEAVRDSCGGLPLALWIAGQLLSIHPQWSVGTLAARLADVHGRLGQLTAGDQEVWRSFAVSYRLLTDDDQWLFRLLSLHPGPDFDVHAAASLAGVAPAAAEQALDRLSQAHLIIEQAAGRFGLHDLLRLFARDNCQETDDQAEQDAAVERLVAHYADVASLLAAQLDDQSDAMVNARGEALALFEAERPSLLAALHIAVERNWDEAGWRLGESLRTALSQLRYLDDLRTALAASLTIARRSEDADVISAVLSELGLVCHELRRSEDAFGFYQEALALRRGRGDLEGQAQVLNCLGFTYQATGRPAEALGSYLAALRICEQIGDRTGISGEVRINLGLAYGEQHRFDDAIIWYQQALAIFRDVDDRHKSAQALHRIGNTYRVLGRLDEAVDSYVKALMICEQAGRDRANITGKLLNCLGIAYEEQRKFEDAIVYYKQAQAASAVAGDQGTAAQALYNLGNMYQAAAELQAAVDVYVQAWTIKREIGDRPGEAETLNNLGSTYRKLQRHEQAVASYRGSWAICDASGDQAGAGRALSNLGHVCMDMQEFRDAVDAYERARTIKQQTGDRIGEAYVLEHLGHALQERQEQGDRDSARACWQAAAEIIREVNGWSGSGL